MQRWKCIFTQGKFVARALQHLEPSYSSAWSLIARSIPYSAGFTFGPNAVAFVFCFCFLLLSLVVRRRVYLIWPNWHVPVENPMRNRNRDTIMVVAVVVQVMRIAAGALCSIVRSEVMPSFANTLPLVHLPSSPSVCIYHLLDKWAIPAFCAEDASCCCWSSGRGSELMKLFHLIFIFLFFFFFGSCWIERLKGKGRAIFERQQKSSGLKFRLELLLAVSRSLPCTATSFRCAGCKYNLSL